MSRLLIVLSALFMLVSVQQSAAQAMVGYADPSKPEYWARMVGYWINAESICGLQYDAQRREALTAEYAAQARVSVQQIKRLAVGLAAEAAPHFTDLSCQNAHNQARRLDLYAAGAKTRPYEEVTVTEMLEEAAESNPVSTETATYTLEIENPRRQNIIRVGVVGGEVDGPVCGSRPACTKTVTMPKAHCGADIRLQLGASVANMGTNWCRSGGVVRVTLER